MWGNECYAAPGAPVDLGYVTVSLMSDVDCYACWPEFEFAFTVCVGDCDNLYCGNWFVTVLFICFLFAECIFFIFQCMSFCTYGEGIGLSIGESVLFWNSLIFRCLFLLFVPSVYVRSSGHAVPIDRNWKQLEYVHCIQDISQKPNGCFFFLCVALWAIKDCLVNSMAMTS